ncbi:MAG TPA: WYL domain-containing protein, partial [Wenzhouxiangella sp.]
LSFPFGQARELVMEILRYGPDVEVQSPDFLREAVSEALKMAIERYQSGA